MRQIDIEHKGSWSISRTVAVALALWITATVAPLHPQTRDSRWIVRGAALGLFPTGDELGVVTLVPEPLPEPSRQRDISEDSGFGVELEYLVKRKIGVELTVLLGDFGADLILDTGELRSMADDDIGFQAVTLGVNYHFTPGKRVDFYVGAVAERMFYDDITLQFPEAGLSAKWRFDDDTGFGFRVGIDVPLKPGRPWIFGAGLRHLRGPLDVKPIILSIGIGYRF